MYILIAEKATFGTQEYVCKEQEFILLCKKEFSKKELKELCVWTLLICALSQYPSAMFIYDYNSKKALLSTVHKLEAELSSLSEIIYICACCMN